MSVVNRKRGGGGTAASIGVDTTNFNQNLSALDDTVQKALDTLDNALGGGGSPPAANVITDTTNFNGILSPLDVDVQLALDTIDDFVVQGLAIYVDKRVITTGDGTFSKPFKTIQEGINAASANDLVIFAPGVYTEQITPKTNVTLLGLARLRCVIKYAANTIDFTAHTGAFVVRNCTILGEPAAGPQTAVMDFNGVCIFTQCTFNWSTLGGGTIPKITADNINTLTWVFMVECGSILPILIDDDDADTHSLRFAIWRLEQDAKFAIDTEDTANIELRHCSFAADVEIGCKAGLSTLILGHSEIYAAGADALTFSSTGGQVQPTVEQCALHSDQAALRFSAATETPVLTNNVLEGDTNDIVVDAGITVGVKLYENNSTPNGGVSCGVGSVFGLPGQKVKNVGATEDSFKNLASAVQSCTSGKHALQLHSDQTLAAQQALNSVALTIDGLDKFNVGGTDLFDLGDDSSLWLENIPLMQGRITVSGDNAHLRLRDTDLTGQTRVTGGDLSTLIELERSKWLGSGAWPIPLLIDDADPTIKISRAVLQAQVTSGQVAVNFTTANNNLHSGYSHILGDGAAQPYGSSAGPIDITSHHCYYEKDPEDGTITNLVARYHRYEVNSGDYRGLIKQATTPTVFQVPDESWARWWDTANSKMYHVANMSGTIYGVELTQI